jgi:putative ABC transport system ATP-binding protein
MISALRSFGNERAVTVNDAPPAGVAVIETRGLSRAVGAQVLVDDVSVQAFAGQILAVTGPSGAGKSSFLRLLNRLDEPTAGSVFVRGKDYRSLTPRDLRRRVGMVLQTAYLFPGSVCDNLAFGPRQRGQSLAPATIARLLERMGLAGFESRDVAHLSGGEAQRVALARTLANDPEVLLLDEPTSALDGAAVHEIETLIRDLVQERDLACVMVTHDPAQATRLAKRTMVVEAGRVIALGLTKDVGCEPASPL